MESIAFEMSDALALTFGSDLSGNSNIATISIGSMQYFTSSSYMPQEFISNSNLSNNRIAWPSGASFALFRPTSYGNSIAIAGAGVISNTSTGANSSISIAATYMLLSSSPTSQTWTIYLHSTENTALTANSSRSFYSYGNAYGGYALFF